MYIYKCLKESYTWLSFLLLPFPSGVGTGGQLPPPPIFLMEGVLFPQYLTVSSPNLKLLLQKCHYYLIPSILPPNSNHKNTNPTFCLPFPNISPLPSYSTAVSI